MALSHSPSIVRSGLIFYYDMSNTRKSWKGAPVTNLYGSIDNSNIRSPNTVHFWDGNSWSTSGSYTHPGVAGPVGTYLGKVYKFTSGALSSTWSGNSYGYMLKTMSTTNGQYNAMSCWAYVSDNCNIDAIPASIESATSTSGISGLPSSYDMNSKGSWQRMGISCTASSSNMNFIPMYPQKYGVTDGSFTGFFMFAMPQVETNTYPSVGTETSRSSAQAILNITNKTNGFAQPSNAVYSLGNTFTFNGSSSILMAGDLSASAYPSDGISNDYTVQLWFKPYVVENYRNVFDATGSVNYGPRLEMNSSGNLVWITGNSGGSYASYTVVSSGLQANVYHNVCITMSGTTLKTYYNGVNITNTTATYTNNGDRFYGVIFGRGFSTSGERWFSGEIPVGKIYNRALSDAEISQNFNALRDRYGI